MNKITLSHTIRSCALIALIGLIPPTHATNSTTPEKDFLGLPKFNPNNLYASTDELTKIAQALTTEHAFTPEQLLTATDLEIDDSHFISLLFKDNAPHTTIGRTVTKYTLLTPADLATMYQRQEGIRFLYNNPAITAYLNSQLQTFGQYEDALLSSFKPGDLTADHFLYWRVPGLKNTNKSSLSLQLGSMLNHSMTLASIGSLSAGSIYGIYSIVKSDDFKLADNTAKFGALMLPSVWGLYSLFIGSIYCYDTHRRETIYHNLQTYLIKVNATLQASRAIYSCVYQHPALITLFDAAALEQVFNRTSTTSQELQHLVALLDSSTFTDHASHLSLSGRILAAYKALQEDHAQLAKAIRAIGELDMYVALARLMQTQTPTATQFCFVTFEDSDTPHFLIKEGWHPYLNPATAVTNTLEIGGNQPRIIILSGPNTGGKSTVVKTVVWNSLLGHRFGIAAAQECSMTEHQIKTNLAQTNGVSLNLSGFDGQVQRIRDMIKSVDSTASNHILVVADEMCSAADGGKNGPALEYATVKYLGNNPHCMMVLATHTPALFTLETAAPNTYRNIHVTASLESDGTIYRPYKVFNGSNKHHGVALTLAKERGLPESVINDAYAILPSI